VSPGNKFIDEWFKQIDEEERVQTNTSIDPSCPDCAKLTGGCGKHPITHGPVGFPFTTPMGWQCPVCRACYAPFMTQCIYCKPVAR